MLILCNQRNHYEKYGQFPLQKEAIMCHTKLLLFISVQMNGTQRRTLVSPLRIHYTHCSMPKGTSRAEVMSNREKNQARSLSHRFEGIKQLISQSVSRKFRLQFFKTP